MFSCGIRIVKHPKTLNHQIMKLLKLIALGTAATYSYNFLTKKDAVTGKSKFDQFKENNPDILEKGKNIFKDAVNSFVKKENKTTYTKY
jgi:hypothetical protein